MTQVVSPPTTNDFIPSTLAQFCVGLVDETVEFAECSSHGAMVRGGGDVDARVLQFQADVDPSRRLAARSRPPGPRCRAGRVGELNGDRRFRDVSLWGSSGSVGFSGVGGEPPGPGGPSGGEVGDVVGLPPG